LGGRLRGAFNNSIIVYDSVLDRCETRARGCAPRVAGGCMSKPLLHPQLHLAAAGVLWLVSVLTSFCIAAAHSKADWRPMMTGVLAQRAPASRSVALSPSALVGGRRRGRTLEHTGGVGSRSCGADRRTCGAGGSASKQRHSNVPSGAATAASPPTLLLGFTRMKLKNPHVRRPWRAQDKAEGLGCAQGSQSHLGFWPQGRKGVNHTRSPQPRTDWEDGRHRAQLHQPRHGRGEELHLRSIKILSCSVAGLQLPSAGRPGDARDRRGPAVPVEWCVSLPSLRRRTAPFALGRADRSNPVAHASASSAARGPYGQASAGHDWIHVQVHLF